MATTRKKKPKYRSGLEKKVGEILAKADIVAGHEVEILRYRQPEIIRKYLVDFSIPKAPELIVEAKGRFTSDDRKKMLFIRDQYPERKIVMIFGRSQNTLSKVSKTTYAAWCDANGIGWMDIKAFEKRPTRLLAFDSDQSGVLKQLSKGTHKKTRRTLANSAN